ncbi:pyridoxal phosphate-dependent aminotransferase [Pararhizobium haloflavum]|uniref:pyridoxal phosphate-dependent aminotransferase n=1 Tax=Pararhizobium haloflavum TaxID=2037914 RepID=UPI000C17673A|nr:pyridoxal phosphate-dependent aminotransferase [Pararhizobium haloflavum]
MTGFQRFTPLLESLPATVPFVGPETQERQRGATFDARLGANESGFGPAPSVIKAMADSAADAWKYCDAENYRLRTALSRHLGVPYDAIVIGEGIDGLLGLIARMIIEAGAPVVTSLGAYPTFNYHVAGFGGRLVTVPYRDDREDLAGLADAVRRENAPLVYLANPDNPMGSWWAADEITRFVEALPDTTMLILDEAYGETAPADALPKADAFLDRPNVVRMRTFSKAYGLAGLRMGYAFGEPSTIKAFDKIRNHFGINRQGQIAAEAALKDQAHLVHVVKSVAAARERIGAMARDNGLTPLPSATNFVAIDCGRDGDFARAVLSALVKNGVFVRMPGVAPLDRCIRVSTGPDAELDILQERLPDALAAAGR